MSEWWNWVELIAHFFSSMFPEKCRLILSHPKAVKASTKSVNWIMGKLLFPRGKAYIGRHLIGLYFWCLKYRQ